MIGYLAALVLIDCLSCSLYQYLAEKEFLSFKYSLGVLLLFLMSFFLFNSKCILFIEMLVIIYNAKNIFLPL